MPFPMARAWRVACIPRGRGHLKLNSQARDSICVYEKVKVATTVCGYLHYVLVTHVLKANILAFPPAAPGSHARA